MKKLIISTLAVALMAFAAAPHDAEAKGRWDHPDDRGHGYHHVNNHVNYHVRYVAPRPIVYHPAPRYYAPRPVVYQPYYQPVYYTAPGIFIRW